MRRAMALVAGIALAVTGGMLVHPEPAEAHGASIFPGSRQYFCWVDGLEDNGQILPKNPACQDAVAQSGVTPLYNWFGNLHPNASGQTVGFIPDGRICDGGDAGPYDFSPYNMMRDDWPRTHLTAGDTYEFRHNNWAQHPGRFDVYLTVQGWDPTAPLSWSDLELIDTAPNPPQTGGPGGLEFYFWDITFPSNRSGQHLVFTHWVRSDSPENFYSCSDVIFDGGNGEVSGLGGDPGPIEPPPPVCPDDSPEVPGPAVVSDVTATSAHVMWGAAAGCVTAYELVDTTGGGEVVLAESTGTPPFTMADLTELEPETSYALAVRARNDNTGEVSALTESAPFTTLAEDAEPPVGDCTASYQVVNDWGAGFQAEVTVTNTGDADIDGWQIGWTFLDGQQVGQLWHGNHQQQGADVTVDNEPWNGQLPAGGGSVTVGFLGTPGGGSAPSMFSLNGTACTTA